MTCESGAVRYHSNEGANRLHSQIGTDLATSQKKPLKAATMAMPSNL